MSKVEKQKDKNEVIIPALVGKSVQDILLAARHRAIVNLNDIRVKK